MAELARHKSKEDCWQAYGGKVYNVTPFLKYHPGGVPELMRAAGKDGEFFFGLFGAGGRELMDLAGTELFSELRSRCSPPLRR